MYVLLITRLSRGVGRWTRKQINHTSWVTVVTQTDRPKSVRNRCINLIFVELFVLSLCPFDISVSVGAFVLGLSQISSFLSLMHHWGIVKSHANNETASFILQTVYGFFAGSSTSLRGSSATS